MYVCVINTHERMYVRLYVCVYLCIYACVIYVFMYTHTTHHTYTPHTGEDPLFICNGIGVDSSHMPSLFVRINQYNGTIVWYTHKYTYTHLLHLTLDLGPI